MDKNKITRNHLILITKYKKEPIRAEEKVFQTLELLNLNEKFVADINKIKSKNNLKKEKIGNHGTMATSTSEFENDVENLRKKYNLSGLYKLYLRAYCIGHNFSGTAGAYIVPSPDYEIDKEQKFLALKIYPETTIKDIQSMWPKIQKDLYENIKHNVIKNRISNNLKRDIEIYHLKSVGKKQMEIRDIINKKYPKNIIAYQEIPKIISRLKKALSSLTPSQDS